MERGTIEVIGALLVLCGVYLKFKSAFSVAIMDAIQPLKIEFQTALQPIQTSIEKLTVVIDLMREEMSQNRETIHGLELKVQQLETNVDNQHRRIKILEAYHKDRSAENA